MIAGIKCFDFYFVFKSKFFASEKIETPPTQFPGVPSPIPLSFLCIPQHMMLFLGPRSLRRRTDTNSKPPQSPHNIKQNSNYSVPNTHPTQTEKQTKHLNNPEKPPKNNTPQNRGGSNTPTSEDW